MKNESIRKVINVDRPNYAPIWTFKQEDDAVLNLSLIKGSTALDITGQTVKLGVLRADKTLVELEDQSCFRINDNELDVTLKNNILSIPGIAECDLTLIDASGKMTTASFFIEVKKKTTGLSNILGANLIEGLEKLKNDFKSTGDKLISAFSKEYESLKRIIIDENQAANLQDQVNQTNAHLADIETKALMKNNNNKPLLALIFDDGLSSVFLNGRDWFANNNVKVGLALHNYSFQKKQMQNHLDISEIGILINDGHEVLSHNYKDEYLNTDFSWGKWLIYGSANMYKNYNIKCRGYVPAGGVIIDGYMSTVKENFDYAFCNYSNDKVDFKNDKYHLNRVQIDTVPYSTIEPILENVANEKGMLFLFSHDLSTTSSNCDNISAIARIVEKAKELGYEIDTPENCLIKGGVIEVKNDNIDKFTTQGEDFGSWDFAKHSSIEELNFVKEHKNYPVSNSRIGVRNAKESEYVECSKSLNIELSDVNTFGEFSFNARYELDTISCKISTVIIGYNNDSLVKYLAYKDFDPGSMGEDYVCSQKFGIDKDSNINKIVIKITLVAKTNGTFITRLSQPNLIFYQY
nr:BppU family phage baseplate upper protein [Clostridium paraputrificum]